REIWKSAVEGICRNSVDAEISRDVLGERVQILGRNTIAIEINAECVNQPSKTSGVADGNVNSANRRISAHCWKRVCDYVICAVIVKTNGNIILGTAASRPDAGSTQGVVHTNVEVVAVCVRRSDVVEILGRPRQVR